jgi:hypothetical protein
VARRSSQAQQQQTRRRQPHVTPAPVALPSI